MKVIAFYLPQFHPIPENDVWWGKGFTEWTNTKKCRPFYINHYQPKEPLNDNYYNLLEKETFQWQISLANQYGIDGFCFYHYYFDGEKLLEKPLELFLENKDLEISFCFSWANHSWTRTWVEKQDLLLEQTYGKTIDWVNHFNYLLKFFKDNRYIRINDKPIFIFNRPLDFENAEDMVLLWDKLAVDNGFSGMYFIETLSGFQRKGLLKSSSGLLESEPSYTYKNLPISIKTVRFLLKFMFPKTKPLFNFYNLFWKIILKRKPLVTDKKVYGGAFINWDNSARRPVNANIFLFFSPQKFYNNIKRQLLRCKNVYNTDYLFINAWNEWAEGNYMEPDKKYNYQILEAIQKAKKETN